jgi:hypothetical protein
MTSRLKLRFLDVYGDPLEDIVDVFLQHQTLSHAMSVKARPAAKALVLANLDPTAGGTYRVLIFPMRHHAVSRFIRVFEDKQTSIDIVHPIDAGKVQSISAPVFDELPQDLQSILAISKSVEGLEGQVGETLYEALDDRRKAGLLNLYCKMSTVRIASQKPVFSYLLEFTRLRGARVFGFVSRALRDDVISSVAQHTFHEEPGGLHSAKPPFKLLDSYKTAEHYGNLQLTFFADPMTLQFLVDADIDDAQGIEHAFQVISHTFSGKDSDPYDLHEILVGYQHLDPGYTLVI